VSSYETLLCSQPADSVWQIVLNRPRSFNVLNLKALQELHSALSEFEDSGAHVLILSGEGRAFCFGADFLEFQNQERVPALLESFQELIRRLYHCPQVTIACLNGFASGAGLDLALSCDLRMASEKARLSEAYVNMGLVCDGGASFFLPRLTGQGRALAMLLTGDPISAAEAQSCGLVHFVCPPDQLEAKTLGFATVLAAKPQKALRSIKQLLKEAPATSLEEALQREKQAQLVCLQDPDHREVVARLLKKKS
jgi:enoyl-CoA hydratase/carnithine racemase